MPESLEAQETVIRDAFYSQIGGESVVKETASGGYISETYDNYVIGSFGHLYFKIPFSKDGDEITFSSRDEWTEVEEKREWIAKTLRDLRTLKTISKTADELRVGNYIALFGGRDLEGIIHGKNPDGTMGEYFTPDTNFESFFTKTGILYIDWEHGVGQKLDGKASPGPDDILGYVDWKTAKPDDMGIWVERVLDRRNQYVKYMEVLIDAGMIANSSSAITKSVVKTKSGEITKWPLDGDTFTVWPMEPRMMTQNVVSAVKGLAKDYPHLEALLPEGSKDSTHNATADDEGGEYPNIQLRARAMLALD